MGKISAVINTLNEERNISDCILSLAPFVDEILICDMHSEDKTVEIAKSLGAKCVLTKRHPYVEPARKVAIENASNEWVLVLDADERMTENLGKKLRNIADSYEGVQVVKFWSLYWFFGDWVEHGGFFSGNWPRFFRKETYLSNYSEKELMVHKNFASLKGIKNTLQLSKKYYIRHYAYNSVDSYVTKTVAKYSLIEASNYFDERIPFRASRLILNPAKEFFVRYLLKGGFRHGTRGLILSFLYSVYRFNVWANLWFLYQKEK